MFQLQFIENTRQRASQIAAYQPQISLCNFMPNELLNQSRRPSSRFCFGCFGSKWQFVLTLPTMHLEDVVSFQN